MPNVTFLHPPLAPMPAAPLHPLGPEAAPDSAFWCAAIGAGAAVIADLAPHIDVLSQRIGQLPVRAAITRPVVGQYLSMVKTLAAAWGARSRPALVAAMDALVHVGDSVAQPGPQEALARRRSDGGRSAIRALDALRRRLAAPANAFGALDTDFGSYLAQMARASSELECDTGLVTQRVQADHVHAFLLSQQANALQSKLDDANLRQHAYWLLGPHAEHLRQEISLHTSALEGVRRQLDHLRADQAATRAEADYLQSLLPSLSTYLAAVDRMGTAIHATLGGTQALLLELGELERILTIGAGAGDADQLLRGALPYWKALAASAARLRPGSFS